MDPIELSLRNTVPAAARLFRAEFLREVGAWSETMSINKDGAILDMLCSLAKRWKQFLRAGHALEYSEF